MTPIAGILRRKPPPAAPRRAGRVGAPPHQSGISRERRGPGGVGERVAGCEFRHRGHGTDQMPDAQKGTNQTMVGIGSVCMIALFVLLSRATVSIVAAARPSISWPAHTRSI